MFYIFCQNMSYWYQISCKRCNFWSYYPYNFLCRMLQGIYLHNTIRIVPFKTMVRNKEISKMVPSTIKLITTFPFPLEIVKVLFETFFDLTQNFWDIWVDRLKWDTRYNTLSTLPCNRVPSFPVDSFPILFFFLSSSLSVCPR